MFLSEIRKTYAYSLSFSMWFPLFWQIVRKVYGPSAYRVEPVWPRSSSYTVLRCYTGPLLNIPSLAGFALSLSSQVQIFSGEEAGRPHPPTRSPENSILRWLHRYTASVLATQSPCYPFADQLPPPCPAVLIHCLPYPQFNDKSLTATHILR